jgi:hypothetical protein
MRKLNVVLAVLVLLAVSCAPKLDFSLANIDLSGILDDFQRELIAENVDYLEHKLGDGSLHSDNGFKIKVEVTELPNFTENGVTYALAGAANIGPTAFCKMYLNPVFMKRTLLTTVTILHEIGHCFGLKHSPNKSDIMYAHSDANGAQFTEESVNKFVADLNELKENRKNDP